jgi:hypothetical protein
MDKRLIFRYQLWERLEYLRETQPLSGLRWQAVNDREAGRKPEVGGTGDQEKANRDESSCPYHKPTQVDG